MGLLLMPVYVTVPRAGGITQIGLWVSESLTWDFGYFSFHYRGKRETSFWA